jgi:hypothetical protein
MPWAYATLTIAKAPNVPLETEFVLCFVDLSFWPSYFAIVNCTLLIVNCTLLIEECFLP